MWPTMEATHFLESRGQVLLAASKYSMEATHALESQRDASSAGSKCGQLWKPLTRWGSEDSCHHQQCPNAATETTHPFRSLGQVS